MNKQDNKIILLLSKDKNTYIPQVFANEFSQEEWHLTNEDIEILNAGPDHEWYWDAWQTVLNTAYLKDDQMNTWYLLQGSDGDGDLHAVREDCCFDCADSEYYCDHQI